MTIADLASKLQERSVSIQIHIGPGPHYVVWIYAPDDPMCMFIGACATLEHAIEDALRGWDMAGADDDVEVCDPNMCARPEKPSVEDN